MPKKKGSHVDPVWFPRSALLARVLPSFVNDCVTVQICVFQPERGVDESGELGKDKWRQRLLSAMAAGNPVNFSLSHSRLHLSRALFPLACATVFILHSLVVARFFPLSNCATASWPPSLFWMFFFGLFKARHCRKKRFSHALFGFS